MNRRTDAAFVGVDILSACDIRLASETAVFGILVSFRFGEPVHQPKCSFARCSLTQEVDVGLAADIGTLQRFPKIIGNDSITRELAFTGRKFNASEAVSMGFVSRVVQGGLKGVEHEAMKMGGLIASKSPIAVLGTKNILNCKSLEVCTSIAS